MNEESARMCNFCGNPLRDDEAYASPKYITFGYGSEWDGDTMAFRLCFDCRNNLVHKFVDACKIKPKFNPAWDE